MLPERYMTASIIAVFFTGMACCIHPASASQFVSLDSLTNIPTDVDAIKPCIVNDTVVLQALDKVTARVKTIEAKIGKIISFGTLNIQASRCLKTLPEDPPEAVAYLEINENSPSADLGTIFQGWMFASNPSLSALEHPVYDIWIKDCKGTIVDMNQTAVNPTAPTANLDQSALSISPDTASTVIVEEIEDNPPIISAEPVQELRSDTHIKLNSEPE